MKRYLFFIFIFICLISKSWAAYIYIDNGAIESDATWSGVDGESYTSSHESFPGAGTGYVTISDGIAGMAAGDIVYMREGVYTDNDAYGESMIDIPVSKNGTAWTEGNYSKLTSFPTEWAILDGDGSAPRGVILGHKTMGSSQACVNDTPASSEIAYWMFERFELYRGASPGADGEGGAGLWVAGGPVKIRYVYFNDCWDDSYLNNPSGLTTYRLRNSTVEYCYFYHNGSEGVNGQQVDMYSDYKDESGGCTDIVSIDIAQNSNVFHYNFFDGGSGTLSENGLKHKASQILGPSDGSSTTYEEYGDKIHHNIFINHTEESVILRQDYAQFYNNIVEDARVAQSQFGGWRRLRVNIYNNTLIGVNFRSSQETSCTGSCAPVCTDYCDGTAPPFDFWDGYYSNLVDNFAGVSGNTYQVVIGAEVPVTLSYVVNSLVFDSNYFYRSSSNPATPFSIGNPIAGLGTEYGHLTGAEVETEYGGQTYIKVSSEGADNIMVGGGGANNYITRGAHVVEGAVTIADGGVGGNHPYLSGVTMPSYIGATNPSDNDWVDGVLTDLASTAWLRGTADRDGNDDPTWIEGAEEEAASTPNIKGSTITGGYFN
jgi:hypothetical protein